MKSGMLIDEHFWGELKKNFPNEDLSDEAILKMAENSLLASAQIGWTFIESDLAELAGGQVLISINDDKSKPILSISSSGMPYEIGILLPLEKENAIYTRKVNEPDFKMATLSDVNIEVPKVILTQLAGEVFAAHLKESGEL